MKVLVTGATGMVGSEVMRQALADPDISEVVALVRKPPAFEHSRLSVMLHQNFLDYSGLEDIFRNADACLWCLGISQSLVSREEYRIITYDYALAGAKAMLAANPAIAFLFVSGMGADPTGRSRILFARVKGETENALRQLPFKHLHIARPGGIKPSHPKADTPLVERLWLPLFPLFNLLLPSWFITSEQLAKGLLRVAKHGFEKSIIGNVDLKRI
jgi:uncharacterized protein YbjT (DUF2867 family)